MTLGWTQVSLLIGLWTPYRFNCGRVVSFDMHGRYFGVSKFRILLNAVGRLGSARGPQLPRSGPWLIDRSPKRAFCA